MRLPLIVPSDFFDYGDQDPQFAVLEWNTAVGERVKHLHILCLVLLSKGIIEYESPYEGTLAEICVPSVPDPRIDDVSAAPPEYRHPPNTVICYIETDDAPDTHFSPEVAS